METPELKNALTRVNSTTKLLMNIHSSQLTIMDRGCFLKKIYENTVLDRESCSTSEAESPPENDDVILRKNIFFIANKVPNANELILTLMHDGALLSEEVEEILSQKSNLHKAIAVFGRIITKGQSQFPVLIEGLKKSNNSTLAVLLQSLHRHSEKASSPESTQSWSCKNCTFFNDTTKLVCEMCFKSKDYEPNAANSTLVCPRCTFFNPPGKLYCEVCNNRILPEEDEDDLLEDCHTGIYEDDDDLED